MRISSIWEFRSIVGKVMMVLALAALIGSIDVVPALGKDDHKRMGRHDNRRHYEQRERGHDYYQPYGYTERVYAPIYAPPPPPGISIFFPIFR